MFDTDSLIENAAELGLQLLPEIEGFTDKFGRHELIKDFIIPWSYEAEREWREEVLEKNLDADYYLFIDGFVQRKLNAFKEIYKRS